jgi:hypothetical protein
MSDVRGWDGAMIFQDPITALNPVVPVGRQIAETIRRHQRVNRREAFAKMIELLNHAGIPDPEIRIREYPHQFSGGIRQRVILHGDIPSPLSPRPGFPEAPWRKSRIHCNIENYEKAIFSAKITAEEVIKCRNQHK